MVARNSGSLAARMARMAGGTILALCAAISAAMAQGTERAAPVTGPGVTTIGGIGANSSVNVRGGPAVLFPIVGTLGYGTRVDKGLCVGGGSARWCQVTSMDGRVSGYVSARFLVEGGGNSGGDDMDGGPDYWAVTGVASNDRLNVRLEPSSSSPALATLRQGEIVRNLGCRKAGNTRWCKIRSTTGMDVTGWVAGRYLRESGAPTRPPVTGPGPDFFVVAGLAPGDTLNLRSQPSTQGAVLAQVGQGARVQNLECRQSGQTRWCRVRTTGGVQVTGWANARYLR